MDIKPVKTNAHYRNALSRIENLMFVTPNTPEGDRLDILVTLVQAYEAIHFPLGHPDPIAAIKFHMEQTGMTAKDLVPSIGRQNRVYEVLNGKCELTLPMIRNLTSNLGIPTESLIGV